MSKRNAPLLLRNITKYFVFPIAFLITLSFIIGFQNSPFTKQVEAEVDIEIYSIEDLNAMRNDLTASYVLMNDLDFEDPASWEDYATNYDIIMNYSQPAGTIIEDEVFAYCDYENYTVAYAPINTTGTITVKVNNIVRDPYEAGVTGGWQVTDYTTGTIAFFDIDGNPITASVLYATSRYSDVNISYPLGESLYLGWEPIGPSNFTTFEGLFDGQGYTISNLMVNKVDSSYIGLFGYNRGVLKNIGLDNVDLTAYKYVGGLSGYNTGTISTSYTTGSVTGNLTTYTYAGGLVGYEGGAVMNSYSSASVTGYRYIGGLCGYIKSSMIINSYSTGVVTGTTSIGGLIGYLSTSTVTNSFWDTEASTIGTSAGGVGKTTLEMMSLSTYQGLWDITETTSPDQYIWVIEDGATYPMLLDNINPSSYLTQAGGYYLISTLDDFDLFKVYSTVAGLKFQLSSNIDLSTRTDYYIPFFTGELDGNGYEISNLNINLSGSDYLGLFGKGSNTNVISNLGVVNVNITGNNYIGGIVGENFGDISNSYVTGTIAGASYVGGITGYSGKTITGTSVNASVTGSSSSYVGGITGYNYTEVNNSSFEGSIIGASLSYNPLVGSNYYSIYSGSAEVTNSFYNYDTTTIDGAPLFTRYTLEQQVFDDWISNNLTFDLTLYFTQEGEYYLIDSISDLQFLRSFGWDSTLKFKLIADLDLSSNPGLYIPIRDGEFDGNGHVISNLFLNMPDQSFVGLFGSVGGTIKNLGVTNVNVTGYQYVGSIAGSGSSITNSYATGTVTATETVDSYVGGLTGNGAVNVSSSAFIGSVNGTGSKIGFLSGYNNISGNPGLENCFYNYDLSDINGVQSFTIHALEQDVFDDWFNNGFTFDLSTYFTQEGEYSLIDSVEDLLILKNFGWDKNLKVKLANNIDLTSNPGHYLPFFSGEFDGNGFTISNILINKGTTNNIGFIGELTVGARVLNLGVDVDITGYDRVGGLVGTSLGTVSGSYSTGTVVGNFYTGGLVGYNDSDDDPSAVYSSYSSATVTTTGSNTGGLVGLSEGIIRYSYTNGSVAGNQFTGGIVGRNDGVVSNTYSEAPVTGTVYTGGLVGSNYVAASIIDKSYSVGSVTSSSTKGGLLGYKNSSSTVTNSFWNTETSTLSTSAGGTGKTTVEMRDITTFNNVATAGLDEAWNILADTETDASIWTIENTITYPTLTNVTNTPDGLLNKVDGYYIIQDINDLKAMIYNFLPYFSAKFKLAASIDLVSEPGLYIPYFGAELDGNGFDISNLYLNIPETLNVGLVGELVPSGVIKNLGVTNVDVTGNRYVGGLVGYNDYGTVEDSYLTGSVEAAGSYGEFVGGVIGYNNYGVLRNSYSTTNVTGIDWGIGGLIGYSLSGAIENCYWEGGTVQGTGSYTNSIGGLIGYNEGGRVTDSHSSGTISGVDWIGGLIGYNAWWYEGFGDPDDYRQVINSYSSADVFGSDGIGGLVGYQHASRGSEPDNYWPNIIENSYATGAVTCTEDNYGRAGGLIGYNDDGTVYGSYSTGTVSCNTATGENEYVGGLMGTCSDCTVSHSYTESTVIGGYSVGGFVGEFNDETISTSYSTGDVSGDDNVGGFAGAAYGGVISNSYTESNVLETDAGSLEGNYIGGFVGYYSGDGINNSYSTGLVTTRNNSTNFVGGFVGYIYDGSITSNSFWDTESSTQSSSTGGTGKTTAQMKTLSTFNNISTDGLDSPWDIVAIADYNTTTPNTWYINETVDYARLYYQSPDYVPGTEPGEEPTDPPPVEEDVDPVISTSTPTDIDSSSATLNGVLSNLGTYDTVYVYFKYRESGAGVWIESSHVAKAITGSYSFSLIDLNPDTTYEYSASANFGTSGNVLGEIRTFDTAILVVDDGDPVEEPTTEPTEDTTEPEETTTPTPTTTPTQSTPTQSTPESEEDDEVEEQEEAIEDNEEETTPQVNLTTVRVKDQDGNPLIGATVEIEGRTYTTDSNGQFVLENLDNRNYKVKITYNGKEYTRDIESLSTQRHNIEIEIELDEGINWVKILIYVGIGLLLLLILLLILGKKREEEDNENSY